MLVPALGAMLLAPVGSAAGGRAERGSQRLWHLGHTAQQLTAPTPPSAACPVVGGVVDASKCGGGFDPANATLALRAALASGAHTVRIPAMGGRPWHIAPIPGVDKICPVDP